MIRRSEDDTGNGSAENKSIGPPVIIAAGVRRSCCLCLSGVRRRGVARIKLDSLTRQCLDAYAVRGIQNRNFPGRKAAADRSVVERKGESRVRSKFDPSGFVQIDDRSRALG